jgi:predicted DNA-binding antitoxin AbrB/MazE fold protein
MTKQVEAVYENGVLRPLEPLSLDEHQRVIVIVSSEEDPLASIIDHAFVERSRKEVQAMNYIPSLEEVRKILSKIPGSLSEDIRTERKDRF